MTFRWPRWPFKGQGHNLGSNGWFHWTQQVKIYRKESDNEDIALNEGEEEYDVIDIYDISDKDTSDDDWIFMWQDSFKPYIIQIKCIWNTQICINRNQNYYFISFLLLKSFLLMCYMTILVRYLFFHRKCRPKWKNQPFSLNSKLICTLKTMQDIY